MSKSENSPEQVTITSAQQVHDQITTALHGSKITADQALDILRADFQNYNSNHCRPEDQAAFRKQVQELLEKGGILSKLHIDVHSLSGETHNRQTGFATSPECQQEATGQRQAHDQNGRDILVLPLENFASVAKRILDKIDSNGVTKQQLAEATQNPAFTGAEAQALAAMYLKFDVLHNLSRHEERFSTVKITSGDLDKFQQIQLQHKEVADRSQIENFLDWSRHSNHIVAGKEYSKDDLVAEMQTSQTSSNVGQAIRFLQDHFTQIANPDGKISRDSINHYVKSINSMLPTQESQEGSLLYSLQGTLELLGQEPIINRNLYALDGSIQSHGVHQGRTGDCDFEASLTAVALAHPEMIKDAIRDNHDGTYTVTFPDAKDKPITVSTPTDTELTLYNHGNQAGLWASVLEKAYGKYFAVVADQHLSAILSATDPFLGAFNSPAPGNTWTQPPYQALADGGDPGKVMKLLTGHNIQSIYTAARMNPDKQYQASQKKILLKALEVAFPNGGEQPVKAVVANNSEFSGNHIVDGFTTGHAFSIIAYYPDGHGSGRVTVRDPAKAISVRDISLERLMSNFKWLYFES